MNNAASILISCEIVMLSSLVTAIVYSTRRCLSWVETLLKFLDIIWIPHSHCIIAVSEPWNGRGEQHARREKKARKYQNIIENLYILPEEIVKVNKNFTRNKFMTDNKTATWTTATNRVNGSLKSSENALSRRLSTPVGLHPSHSYSTQSDQTTIINRRQLWSCN